MLSYAKTSFAGGEFSVKAQKRTDLAKYPTGLSLCRNFIPNIYGGAHNRPGLYFIKAQGDENYKARVIPFIFSQDQSFALEFGNNYVRFITDQGFVEAATPEEWQSTVAYSAWEDYVTYSGATYYSIQDGTNKQPDTETAYWREQSVYQIYSPFTETDLPNLVFSSSADVIFITSGSNIVKKLIRSADNSWAFEDYDPVDGPFMPENTTEASTISLSAVTGSITLSAASAIFDVDHVGALWKIIHFIEGNTASSAITSATSTSSISCFTTWRLITHGTWTGKIRVEKSTDGGSTWTTIRSFSSSDDYNVDTYGTEDVEVHDEPFLVRVTMYNYTSGTCNVDLTTDSFYQEGIGRITAVNSSTEAEITALKDFGDTVASASWAEGAWSDYRGYPTCLGFVQDRLAFGGAGGQPMKLEMSKTADYESHGKNQLSLLSTDRISINLLSRQINPIVSVVPLDELIVLTSGSEWVIGSQDGVLTPTSVRQKPQGYRGASSVQPIVIGNQIIYVQYNGSIIRNLFYSDTSAGFTGEDIRILAEHFFVGRTVVDMAYQQDPDSVIWVVLDNGDLLSCTYLYEQEVLSWAKHPTDGYVESICSIPATGYDEIIITVKRDDRRFVERMVQRLASTDVQDQFFVDSGLTFDNPISITGISQADPCVITCASAHGFTHGDSIDVSDITGMTELNLNRYKIHNPTALTFELVDLDDDTDIDSTLYTTYVSGGYVRKCYTTFSGFDHLEGKEITILGNGQVYPLQTVSGGSITLSNPCSRVHGGLPYNCDLKLLDLNVDIKTGSMMGKKIKICNVLFNFINSLGGNIGPDVDNLYEAFIPNEWREGTPAPLKSGWSDRVPLGAGYEDGGTVYFRQADPLPVEITTIVMEYEVGG